MDRKMNKFFKPFLVENDSGTNIFRVMNLPDDLTRGFPEKLLERLPVCFKIQKELSSSGEYINEPLEVYIHGLVVYIYPPRHRVITCATFNSWEHEDVVSKMHVDNVMDISLPGNGQIRSCVHFDPKIIGIEGWPGTESNELEVDMFVYPKDKENETRLQAPIFGKHELRSLLELIAGGENRLTTDQLNRWRGLVLYAVNCMKACYENIDTPEDYPVRVYYKKNWARIAEAKNDEDLADALEDLRGDIQWE